ncbi:MAG TPA: TRAP transporter small permease [Methylomirabilota bacterium]|nr:TRAP transporter small permease [Methylomirabilota bacterium]
MTERFIHRLALLSAELGGVVLAAVIVMTGASILGRALNGLGLGPVPGDFELVEAGIGFAVFAFLPIAQLKGAHATVDVFTSLMGVKANRVLLAIWEVAMALVFALIAWRLFEGLKQKFANGETTFLLQFPVWWVFAACMAPAVIAVIVAVWSAYDRLRAVATGLDTRPVSGESVH